MLIAHLNAPMLTQLNILSVQLLSVYMYIYMYLIITALISYALPSTSPERSRPLHQLRNNALKLHRKVCYRIRRLQSKCDTCCIITIHNIDHPIACPLLCRHSQCIVRSDKVRIMPKLRRQVRQSVIYNIKYCTVRCHCI